MYNQTELKDLIERAIANLSFGEEAENLTTPVKYVLSIGGKRIRPTLSLMACNLFKDKIDEAVIPSVGIEVFHNFTLVHDDIMDNASLRRNLPTVHEKWNVSQAILSGDVMAFIANDCFLQTPQQCLISVFKTFNSAAVEVCLGQQLDMDFEKSLIVSDDEYLRMIELKTAVLLAASAKIGAIIGEAGDKDCNLLYEFGRNLGLAFQIQDDILDAYGDSKVFGKKPGGDIITNKKTFLLVKALELASGNTLKMLQEQLSQKEFDPDQKIKTVMEIYDQLQIRSITENLANDYITKSHTLLEEINAPRERKSELSQMATSLIGRNR